MIAILYLIIYKDIVSLIIFVFLIWMNTVDDQGFYSYRLEGPCSHATIYIYGSYIFGNNNGGHIGFFVY